MSELIHTITSVDDVSAPPAPLADSAPIATAREFEAVKDGGLIPWMWVLAWLIGWALLVAIAAWWIGEVSPREMWMWMLVWAVPGLVVSALLTRAAAQATERTSNLARLSRARREIAQLETQLQTSTESMFSATQTLSEATEMLLQQVDTSRDDLRNQINSAQSLTDSLRAQTEGLVTAQQGFSQSLIRDLTPESETVARKTELTINRKIEEVESLPPLNLRPAPEDPISPPMVKLRPAPPVEESFESVPKDTSGIDTEVDDTTTHPPDAPASLATPASKDWKWSDMLRTVDEVIPPSDSGEEVIDYLKAAGLSPDVLVDEGNAVDAINVWGSTGLPAMGQLLSIRFDEPAREMRAKLNADPAQLQAFQRFSDERASRLDPADRDVRLKDARTEAGRAWLFVQAVLSI